MDKTDAALRLDNQICFAIYATAHAFNKAYKPLLEPLGLTYPQYLVMMALWEQDELRVKDIGRRLNLDSGTLSPLLKRLEKAGFIERLRGNKDERQVHVQLTSIGRHLETKAQSIMPEIVRLTGCEIGELGTLKKALYGLKASLNRHSE
jgi:DNA-binding MarR family transcriptional regulator